MTSTLDETLCDTNPHFSKVLKEKMAVREAAHKEIEARKAALFEAEMLQLESGPHVILLKGCIEENHGKNVMQINISLLVRTNYLLKFDM